jgi:uncharacterized protein with GYD domain
MPKYLLLASYTPEGQKGVLKEGGSKRREAADQAIKSVGGKMEAFYYAFGDTDAYLIVDFPDITSAAAISSIVNASGTTTLKTVPLFTAEEMDQAVRKNPQYRGPGK